MSCSGGRFSISALAVKSASGNASTNTALAMSRKLSVVATSTSMRAGRSARAQTTPESTDTSPDCTPWVICTRSGAKLSEGRARPPIAVTAADAAAVFKNARRVSAARRRIAIGPPPSQRGGKCALILTKTRMLCDDRMTLSWTRWGLFQVPLSGRGLSVRRAGACGRFRTAFGVVDDRGAARGDGKAQLVERERERHAHRLVELLVFAEMDDRDHQVVGLDLPMLDGLGGLRGVDLADQVEHLLQEPQPAGATAGAQIARPAREGRSEHREDQHTVENVIAIFVEEGLLIVVQ